MAKSILTRILETIVTPKEWHFYIVLIIFLMTVIPYFVKPGLPVIVTPETQIFYDTMEELGPGDTVLFSWEITPAGIITARDYALPVWKHLMKKPGLKIVFVTIRNPTAMPLLTSLMDGAWDSGGLHAKEGKYGEEVAFLGFIPGIDIATAAMAEDIWDASGGTDYFGDSLSTLPMMANIRSHEDITLIIETGNVEEGPWMRQWTIPYGTELAELTSLAAYAWLLPWYEVGLIKAMLGGVVAGAEYEYIQGISGHALMTMDVLSLGALIFIAAIIIRNISYHVLRMQGEGVEDG